MSVWRMINTYNKYLGSKVLAVAEVAPNIYIVRGSLKRASRNGSDIELTFEEASLSLFHAGQLITGDALIKQSRGLILAVKDSQLVSLALA